MAINGSPLDGPADCTLACDEGHLTAHKILLCAHSKYLLDILSNFPEAEHPIIILTEINIIDIRILVNYMYTGELTITNDCSPSNILRAAKILRIESLTDFEDEDDSMGDDSLVDEDSPPSVVGSSPPPSMLPSQSLLPQLHQNHHNHHHQQQQQQQPSPAPLQSAPQTQSATSVPLTIPTATVPAASKHPKRESHYNKHHNNNNNNNNHTNNNNINSINHNNKIRCHLCNIGLSDVKCLYRHVLTRHLSEKWGYKCEFCDREFSRDDHLMRHYTTKHKNMEFNREKIRETRRLNREMAKNYHDQISKIEGSL